MAINDDWIMTEAIMTFGFRLAIIIHWVMTENLSGIWG